MLPDELLPAFARTSVLVWSNDYPVLSLALFLRYILLSFWFGRWGKWDRDKRNQRINFLLIEYCYWGKLQNHWVRKFPFADEESAARRRSKLLKGTCVTREMSSGSTSRASPHISHHDFRSTKMEPLTFQRTCCRAEIMISSFFSSSSSFYSSSSSSSPSPSSTFPSPFPSLPLPLPPPLLLLLLFKMYRFLLYEE